MRFIDSLYKPYTFKANPFYDTVIPVFRNSPIPTIHDAYISVPETDFYKARKLTQSAKEFINWMKLKHLPPLKETHGKSWPLKGPLFMYVEIHMLPSEYQSLKNKRKDVDNLAKTLLDSMEKIVYENDSQIRTLMISKYPNEKRQPFLIAIKCLKNDDEQLTKIPNPYLIYSKSTIYDKKQSF